MHLLGPCTVSPRGWMFSLFVAAFGFATLAVPLNGTTLCPATPASGTPPCVLTSQYGNPSYGTLRQGYNAYETVLTDSTVSNLTQQTPLIVDLGPLSATNEILAQPLYVAQISTSLTNCASPCNMPVAVTLSDSVFAWNADTGAVIWSRTGQSAGGAGTTNYFWYDDCLFSGSLPSPFAQSLPFAGIVSTPVIDASGSTPAMFVTSLCQTSSGSQQWWIHEINLYTGYDSATHQQITGPASGLDNADDLASGSIPFNGYEVLQRAALLEVHVSGATPSHLIYVAFGSAVNETEVPYHGWVFGYSGSLAKEFAFATTTKGTSGNTDAPACSTNCTCTVGSCTAGTGCIASGYQNSANWCGHGAGVWMSGKGPAANTLSGVSHAYFGVGNGGFQQWTSGGALLSTVFNWGESIVDFTLSTSGFDSSPSQYFTPYGGVTSVEPPLGLEAGGNPVSYTYQGLNQNDFDMSVSGPLLFSDLDGNQRLVTVDKAGYGYLLRQGNLCGSTGTPQCYPGVPTGQPGLATGDPGDVFPFQANSTACSDKESASGCDRVTSLAFYPDGSANYLYFWPNGEKLTALQLSDNSAQTPTGSPTPKVTSSGTTVTGTNTLFTQWVIPGDQITVNTSPTATTLTVTGITSNTSLTTYQSSSIGTGTTFTYNGYFINPLYDTHPVSSNVQYPGGSVLVTSNSGSEGLVWGLANLGSSPPGAGTVLAYDAGTLALEWCSNSSCTSTPATFTAPQFALPTVVNGNVYIPTYGIAISGTLPAGCSASPCSGLVWYH